MNMQRIVSSTSSGMPYQTMKVEGPHSPAPSSSSSKRPLENAGDDAREKKAVPSLSPREFRQDIPQTQQIADAQFFVKNMSHANEQLSEQIQKQTAVAKTNAYYYLQESEANHQYKHAEQEMFVECVAGLKNAYDKNTEENREQVRAYRAAGERIHTNLRYEMVQRSEQFQSVESLCKMEIDTLRNAA